MEHHVDTLCETSLITRQKRAADIGCHHRDMMDGSLLVEIATEFEAEGLY